MQFNINRRLVAFKAFAFNFGATVGSLWPFLTLHMKLLGLNVEEIAIINLILPFVSAFCKPLFGMIVDKTGKYKIILCSMLFATGAFYTSLLLIPSKSITHNEKPLKSQFICSQNGAHVQTQCSDLISQTNWTVIELTQCSYDCNTLNFNTEHKPSLCLTSEKTTSCMSFDRNESLTISASFDELQTVDNQCHIAKSRVQGLERKVICPYVNSECKLQCTCTVEEKLHKNQTESLSLTFWLYLFLRVIAEAIFSATFPLGDAINLSLTSRFGGSFGQQQLVMIVAIGVFAPLSGMAVDYVSKQSGSETYIPCFIMADIMLLLAIISVLFIPDNEVKTQKQSMTKGLKSMLTNQLMIVIFLVSIALGMVWGYMEVFLYLYLLEKGATRLLIGLTQFMSVIPALPLLYKSMWIVDKVGYANLLIVAFFTYSVRCVGYVFASNPWWALLLESTRAFTAFLPRIALVISADALTAPELKVTTQSLIFLLHFDVGRGVGSLVGGTLKDYLGDTTTFQIIAVYSGILGCAYFCLYHFYLKYRQPSLPTKSSDNSPKEQDKEVNKPQVNGYANSIATPLLPQHC